jgi:hypothetical protein
MFPFPDSIRTVLPNGLTVVTGPANAKVTNTDTGKSKTYNISGPGKIDFATGRQFLKGQNLISNLIDNDELDPFLWVTSGNVSFITGQPIDAPGLRGHISHDVCEELAPTP